MRSAIASLFLLGYNLDRCITKLGGDRILRVPVFEIAPESSWP